MKIKTTSLISLLKYCAPNLYRHPASKIYYAMKKVAGRRKVHSLATADRKTADRKLAAWIRELHATTPGTTPDMTMGQLLTAFAAARAGKKESTIKTEGWIARKMRTTFDAKGQGMGMLASHVRHSHLAIWLALIAKNLRHSSYNRVRLFLMQLFDFACTETLIEKSPFDESLLPVKGRQRIVRRVPTEEEFTKIISEIRQPRWSLPNPRTPGGQRPASFPDAADFAEYLGFAGVGQAEAASLNWEDVSWDRNAVNYTRQKTGKPFSHPIYAWLRPLLERMQAESAGSGRIFKIKDVRGSLNSAKKRLGYPNFTQRGLRAFLIGRLWRAGVDVKVIALWQGHSDGGKLIMDTYTEVFGSNDEDYQRQQLAKAEGRIASKGA